MQRRIEDFHAADTEVLGISCDPPEESAPLARSLEGAFPLLSDSDFAVIRRYGLFHENAVLSRDTSRPASYLLDRDGTVLWEDFTENYRKRPRAEAILALLARFDEAG